MSAVLGKYLISLNIVSLNIVSPVFDYFDNSKFEALYKAISASNLRHLSISPTTKRRRRRFTETAVFSDFPLLGINSMLHSRIEKFELSYWALNVSPLLPILNAIPEDIKELKVVMIIVMT